MKASFATDSLGNLNTKSECPIRIRFRRYSNVIETETV